MKNLQGALTQYYGFKAGDIAVLTDLAATKKVMQAAIRNLVSEAHAGDVLLLHYSGHGVNVPDKNGDEADHRDEILCPADLDWKDPLTDASVHHSQAICVKFFFLAAAMPNQYVL